MATKRQATSDGILERYRSEWQESPPKQKGFALAKALAYCSNHRLPDPPWLHDAIYQPERARIAGLKKAGRKFDLIFDGELYETVEAYRGMGLTEAKAFYRMQQDYKEELTRRSIKRPRPTDYSPTVKSAWVRTKKHIAFDHVPLSWGEGSWRWKDEYLKRGRDWEEWMSDAPSYLKPETKNPTPSAEVEAAARALKSALVPQRTKNKRPRS